MSHATIKLGSAGDEVRTWQLLLGNSGYPVAVTSSFDASTDQFTRSWQKAKGLFVDGVVGPDSWAAMTGEPKAAPAVSSSRADAHRAGRAALAEAWQAVTGRPGTLPELQMAGAMADLESGYGRGSYRLLDHTTGATIRSSGVINNWGAVQTSDPASGFLATDTSSRLVTADNPKGYYDHLYKVYPSPAAGAAHLVEHLTLKRPTAWEYMKRGDIDGFTEAAHARLEAGGKPKVDPQTKMPGYFEQAPSQRAHGLEIRIAEIAQAMGEPVAARRGGPVAPGQLLASPLGAVPKAGGFALLGLIAAGLAYWFFGR